MLCTGLFQLYGTDEVLRSEGGCGFSSNVRIKHGGHRTFLREVVAESMPHYYAHWWIGQGVVSVFSIHHSDWKHPALISPLVTRWRCCFSVQYRCIIMATSIPHYYAHWWIGQGVVSVFSIHHCDWQHLSVLCPLMNRSRCCFGVQHRYIFIMATSISHCSAHWWLGQCVVSVFSIHYSGRKHTSLLCLLVTRSV